MGWRVGILVALACCGRVHADVVLENARCALTIGDDAIVRSLKLKATGEDLLAADADSPLLTVTQERFFNNEIKLAYPSRETTCRANRIVREGDKLVVGFERVPYSAVIGVRETANYIGFELLGFRTKLADYQLGPQFPEWLDMKLPPVKRLRFLQLPVRERQRFGDWLNVAWDDRAAVAVVGGEPYTFISGEKTRACRVLAAEADVEQKLEGTKAALIVSVQPDFLSCLDRFEVDYGLPRGVRDRQSGAFNASVYWTSRLTPGNLDEHLKLMKQGGFRRLLLYHTAVCECPGDYSAVGSYAINRHFGGDPKQVKAMLDRLHREGIEVGLHVLHPFIGFNSDYITPVADHRINLKRHFTLAQPLDLSAREVFVEEDPSQCPTNRASRVLRFGGEILSYEGFTTERPYRFFGVTRGAKKTMVVAHPRGEIGGLVDVCEFGGGACYVDQRTSLQDELADRIAAVYNLGFDFFCMDGCEGVNAPFGINVALGQYRVWKKLRPEPLFTEGAAKAHFAWHHLSGANAFDVFLPREFKEMIVRWPLHESEMLSQDFSSVSFGWWGFWLPGETLNDGTVTEGTQLDMWEFGTSRAAGWDSPTTIQVDLERYRRHPRLGDLMEVMRRWEDVRARKWLTEEQKTALKSATQEHHLFLNARGEYELYPIQMLPPYPTAPDVRGFTFVRNGKRVIAYWNVRGEGEATVPWGANGSLVTVQTGDLKYYGL